MAKWEYCVLHGVSYESRGLYFNAPCLYKMTPTGAEVVTTFQNDPSTNSIGEMTKNIEKTIFQLGEDGWELVIGTVTPFNRGENTLWFKRQKG